MANDDISYHSQNTQSRIQALAKLELLKEKSLMMEKKVVLSIEFGKIVKHEYFTIKKH